MDGIALCTADNNIAVFITANLICSANTLIYTYYGLAYAIQQGNLTLVAKDQVCAGTAGYCVRTDSANDDIVIFIAVNRIIIADTGGRALDSSEVTVCVKQLTDIAKKQIAALVALNGVTTCATDNRVIIFITINGIRTANAHVYAFLRFTYSAA